MIFGSPITLTVFKVRNVLEESISAEHKNNLAAHDYKGPKVVVGPTAEAICLVCLQELFVFPVFTVLRVTRQRTISLRTSEKTFIRYYELLRDPALSETQVNSITETCLRIQKSRHAGTGTHTHFCTVPPQTQAHMGLAIAMSLTGDKLTEIGYTVTLS